MYKEYNGMSLLFTNYIDTALAMILDYSINYYTVTNPITMPVGSLHLNGTDTALPGSLHLNGTDTPLHPMYAPYLRTLPLPLQPPYHPSTLSYNTLTRRHSGQYHAHTIHHLKILQKNERGES